MAVCESSTPDLETIKDSASCMCCQELKDVVKYCVTCRKDCCETCIANLHEDHNTLPIEHPIVRNIKLFSTDTCTTHKDEKWSMYCVTCKTPCCFTCIDESHDAHSLSTIRSITKQAESLYAKLVDDLPQAKSKYRHMQKEYNDYVQNMDVTITSINSQFERLRLTIDEMEASMLHPLEKEVEEVRKMQSDLGQPILEAECLVDLYKAAKDEGGYLFNVIFFSNYLSFESLESEIVFYPQPFLFTPTQMDIPKTSEMIGSVVRSSGQPIKGKPFNDKSNDVSCLEIISLKSVDRFALTGRIIPLIGGTRWVIQDPVLSTWRKPPCWYTSLSIMDKSLLKKKEVLTIENGSFTDMTDVSIVPPSDLVYTDSENCKVWRVSASGNIRLVMSTYPVIPRAVCFTSDKRLALGLCDSSKNKRYLIRTYTLDNLKSLSEIEKDEDGKPLFTYIKSIIENSKGNFIVNNLDDLICISKHGNLKWKLKITFRHFCFDKYSNIVVATDEEIKVLDCNGQYIKTLLTNFDFLSTPTSLSIDTDGLLFIGQGDSTKVLKYFR
ncbi:hypothetical protein FSP39_001830 [Pinctada imbricata]|uniref:B box-type domain-containing protein n=1 Tax=Pinctada imbricata TaxID=66713 RepID=A0AA88YHD6_PINIB|nr:hypothetical protein FSP39_001830 [Pinctada imbricata]